MSVRVLIGDCRDVLRTLPDASVQCCVTSPPYWGLRDYGVTGQLGLESTPAEYVAQMVGVFREVRRVLRDDGTLWLNLGDSYTGSGKGGNPEEGKQATNKGSQSIGTLYGKTGETAHQAAVTNVSRRLCAENGMPPKNLVGIPWRVAFALQADGWYLRSDIIWAKPNPMPESVTDRPTKAHEYMFLLSKQERYYYDAEAIKEPAIWGAPNSPESIKSPYGQGFTRRNNPEWRHQRAATNARKGAGNRNAADGGFADWQPENGRNKRSVWTVSTTPFSGAHFATFPPKLIEPCILAGSRKGDTVLDPFCGAGTTGLVADRLGRNALLIELNPEYAALGSDRITGDAPLFTDVEVA